MFKFVTAGESHGPALTSVIEGLPAGLALDEKLINDDLARRQKGYGRGGRMKIENDKATITSGVRFGYTLGSPLALHIFNKDWDNWQQRMSVTGQETGEKVTAPRPGHADLAGLLKYDHQDVRNVLERASARETAARVAVGSVAKQLLSLADIKVFSHVINIGGVAASSGCATQTDSSNIIGLTAKRDSSELACIDQDIEKEMRQAIDKAKENGDSLGGIIEVIITGVMPGLGSHVQWDSRLDTRLAAALMSIQAIKGVEFGAGFNYASLAGSQAHDEIFYDSDKKYGFYRNTNQAGGIEGGISNGENIVLRVVMKPIPTLMKALASVDITTKEQVRANTERSDVCAVPAASVVCEAMAAIVLAGVFLEKFGSDSVNDLNNSLEHYLRRIK